MYEGMTCLNERVAWVVGYQAYGADPAQSPGVILHTVDGGASWTRQTPLVSGNFWKVSFVGARR